MADTGAIGALLREASETHHIVFRMTDGDDPDWASWYSDWLLEHSELPTILGKKPVRSHLVSELVRLDHDYTAMAPAEDWPGFYARGLDRAFGPPEDGRR